MRGRRLSGAAGRRSPISHRGSRGRHPLAADDGRYPPRVLSGLIQILPNPILFEIPGTLIRVGWYGVGYIVGVAVLILVAQREIARRGIEPRHVTNALIFVAACALIGARLYHVIDQWAYYSQNLPQIVLPPYSGLALYGGVAGGLVGIAIYVRRHRLPFWSTVDACVPGALFAQGIARWGNFFNQELYGPPTDAPWGITIGCDHRIAPYTCAAYPEATTGFHPLFFYESALDIGGGLVALWLSRRHFARLRPGDLASFWFIWYGSVRFVLETFRSEYDWKLLGVAPTAMVIGVLAVVLGVASIVWRHRTPADAGPPQPAAGLEDTNLDQPDQA
ncbi:MAG: phosphatidylglycerol---prolipoprotein diacylglyceryl transferase [Chloroflexota bacterium]|jgi:phosphatidylglycerol:prolipoprotein diacylglycerol transferase|nr:phosphatidylglycerol---prolipoprotein diacylglyceryl transferase [Chloroflexota bacterium]